MAFRCLRKLQVPAGRVLAATAAAVRLDLHFSLPPCRCTIAWRHQAPTQQPAQRDELAGSSGREEGAGSKGNCGGATNRIKLIGSRRARIGSHGPLRIGSRALRIGYWAACEIASQEGMNRIIPKPRIRSDISIIGFIWLNLTLGFKAWSEFGV